MGRVINPDYFKVGAGTAGSGVSKLGRFDDDRSRLAATLARLHREAPHQETSTLRDVERTPAPRKRSGGPSVKRKPPPEPSAVIELFHTARPAHGHKRRSAKKRHEVAVLRSLASSQEPSATTEAAYEGERRTEWRALVLDLLDFAKEVALTPIAIARILSRLRREEREARG
jgi:hypothetical protein